MFRKNEEIINGRTAITVSGLGKMSLTDTLECGQAFRYEKIGECAGVTEYLITVGESLVFVGQRVAGELIFFDTGIGVPTPVASEYFSLSTDFEAIREDVLSHTDSEWLKRAAECASGVTILSQDPWEMLVSFIISQNNNIPRIRKIIRKISAEYGKNLAAGTLSSCPLSIVDGTPCDEKCKNCGICYTFPTARDILDRPEGLLPSKPGFRYKYILDAARRVVSGETDLSDIKSHENYEYTLSELKKILGVGDKVASCVALFGFGNLEAFPIDVWIKRAIDLYFNGSLDPTSLGRYAGVAQQYIFHYLRNLDTEK